MQLPALVGSRALHAEVDRITKAGQSRPPGLWLASLPKAKSGSDAAAQLLAALLKWAQIICAKSGLVLRSWASSFADGQAICLLVSHTSAAAALSTNPPTTESKALKLCCLASHHRLQQAVCGPLLLQLHSAPQCHNTTYHQRDARSHGVSPLLTCRSASTCPACCRKLASAAAHPHLTSLRERVGILLPVGDAASVTFTAIKFTAARSSNDANNSGNHMMGILWLGQYASAQLDM